MDILEAFSPNHSQVNVRMISQILKMAYLPSQATTRVNL